MKINSNVNGEPKIKDNLSMSNVSDNYITKLNMVLDS